MAQDLALFVVFFDLMLVPFFFLTGVVGRRRTASRAIIKLFIYTLVGSLLMLDRGDRHRRAAAPRRRRSTFALSDLARRSALPEGTQDWIFLCFAAAFLVKMPAFPLHGWMPDGYRAMPLPVLAVFSGVLSQGRRLRLPARRAAAVPRRRRALPGAACCSIALASILYGSAMAFTTTDARLILGYSSVAQLGFIALGIFALHDQGAQGAILQAVNHGLVVAPAFFIVALLAARAGGSEDLRDMGGLALRAPVLAAMFLIVTLAEPGDARLVELRRRVPDPARRLQGEDRDRDRRLRRRRAGVASTRCGCSSARCTTASGPTCESREIVARATALVLVPLVLAIIALALYPQLALDKGERVGRPASVAGRAGRSGPSDRPRDAESAVSEAPTIDWAGPLPAHRAARRRDASC